MNRSTVTNTPRQDLLPLEDGQGLPLRGYLDLIWGRKLLIVAVTALSIAATALWTFRQQRVYSASAALLIDPQMPQVLARVTEVVDISPNAYRDVDDYMHTQETVACSSQVAERAARLLNLHQVAAFWGPRATLPVAARTPALAARLVAGSVRCAVRRGASILDVVAEHTDPTMAAQIANAMAQAFMDHNLEYKSASTSGAIAWLAKQLDQLKHQVNASESELYDFRKANDLISMTLHDRQSLTSEQLATLTAQWNKVRGERMALAAEVAQLRAISTSDPLSAPELPAFRSEAIDALKLQALRERALATDLRARYLAQHPKVVAQEARVAQAVADLRRQLDAVVAGTVRRLGAVEATEGALQRAIGQTKTSAYEVNKREIAYRRLEREATSAQNAYTMLMTRMTESELAGRLRSNNVRMLEPAEASGIPVRPRARANLMIGLLLGLLLSLGLVFLLEALDNSVLAQADVEAEGVVFLGGLPVVSGVSAQARGAGVHEAELRELMAAHHPRSPSAEECRAIRTNLLFASPDKPLKRLLITSPSPSEGKTMTATNLAITVAQQGRRVLLVDVDLRRPMLHKVFGVSLQDGLTSALTSGRDPLSFAKATGVPHLSVLTAGPLPPNPAELCHSDRLRAVLDQLAEHFDLVILDSPPVLVVTDAVVLGSLCDGTVLVARSGRTTKQALRQTVRRLADLGVVLFGCVVNGIDVGGYRYKYRYKLGRGGAYAYGHSGSGEGDGPARG
ncbi:MAG: polysaccharide biosynthesis tyrosine autokinase [Proteobacteria bacterium]|nr:polysaccharide biosynthesis tyrosine autokinase [Pseudomonadota bacterium]